MEQTLDKGMSPLNGITPDGGPYLGCRLVRLLHGTSHSQVWHAVSADDQSVALKFIACDSRAARFDVPMLLTWQQLNHPHLLSIHSFGRCREHLILAMELGQASLRSLYAAFRAEFGIPLPAERVCHYLAEVAAALDYLGGDARGGGPLIRQHGNVKPSNLLLVNDRVKVADFKLSSETTFGSTPHRLRETLRYAAPEVHQGWVSQRSDQFALAVIYCEFRGGWLPFPEPPEPLGAASSRTAPDLSILPAPERLIVARALSPDPDERYDSCGELVSRLAAAG
jgi:serine/threonine protein kinase